MAAQMHQIMPRLRFVPADETCTSDCAITDIEYTWLRRSPSGWVVLTGEEARVLEPVATLDLVLADGGTMRSSFPAGTPHGSPPGTAWTTRT